MSAPSVDKSGQRVTSPGVRDKGEKKTLPTLMLSSVHCRVTQYTLLCVSHSETIMEAGAPDYLLDWSSRGRKDIIFMTFTPEIRECNSVIKHQDSGAL